MPAPMVANVTLPLGARTITRPPPDGPEIMLTRTVVCATSRPTTATDARNSLRILLLVHTAGRCALSNFDPEDLIHPRLDLRPQPRSQDFRSRVFQAGDLVEDAMVDQIQDRLP